MNIADHPLYGTWTAMRNRCNNPNNYGYRHYGGRGISVCAAWNATGGGFQRWLADMGPRPSADHSVDRINNDGNYEPGNCRWATAAVQSANRPQRFGERVGNAKLANVSVEVIRAVYAAKAASQYELARWFGVTQANISLIVRGESRRIA